MNSNYIFLSENTIELFFNIFNSALSDYFLKKILKVEDFYKFIKSLNTIDSASFILIEKNDPVGIFLGSVNGRSGYIPAVGVIGKYRSMGYGRILIQKGLSLLNECKAANALLEVLKNNSTAINLYKSEGFTIKNNIISLRNESNSFYNKNCYNDIKTIIGDKFTFSITYKTFNKENKPWQKKLGTLLNKIKLYDPDLYIFQAQGKTAGYALITRDKNYLLIHDIALKDDYSGLFSFYLTSLLTNEKIVQSNCFYENDRMSSLFLKNGFYIDTHQYEMEKVLS